MERVHAASVAAGSEENDVRAKKPAKPVSGLAPEAIRNSMNQDTVPLDRDKDPGNQNHNSVIPTLRELLSHPTVLAYSAYEV